MRSEQHDRYFARRSDSRLDEREVPRRSASRERPSNTANGEAQRRPDATRSIGRLPQMSEDRNLRAEVRRDIQRGEIRRRRCRRRRGAVSDGTQQAPARSTSRAPPLNDRRSPERRLIATRHYTRSRVRRRPYVSDNERPVNLRDEPVGTS